MGKKETGWLKRYTQIVSGWRERMRSVSAPQAIIIILADGATSPYEPLLVQLETKRELTLTFLLCTSSHVISLNPLPSSSMQPASATACVPACLPARLSSRPLRSHATGRVGYIKASSSPLISAWQRGWSWLCFRYTDPCSLASA